MKLALFTSQFPGKVSTFFARDVRGLLAAGVEVDVFSIYPEDRRLWKWVPEVLDESVFPRSRVHHASHVEYTRLIAEHGLLGLIAGLLLLSFVVRPFANGSTGFTKAVVLAGAVLALAALAASGMRTAMPGFLLGLTWARVSVLPRRIPQWNGVAFRVAHRGVPSPRG